LSVNCSFKCSIAIIGVCLPVSDSPSDYLGIKAWIIIDSNCFAGSFGVVSEITKASKVAINNSYDS